MTKCKRFAKQVPQASKTNTFDEAQFHTIGAQDWIPSFSGAGLHLGHAAALNGRDASQLFGKKAHFERHNSPSVLLQQEAL